MPWPPMLARDYAQVERSAKKQKSFGSFLQKRTSLLFLKKKKQKDFYSCAASTEAPSRPA
jgi:hypothetical protein